MRACVALCGLVWVVALAACSDDGGGGGSDGSNAGTEVDAGGDAASSDDVLSDGASGGEDAADQEDASGEDVGVADAAADAALDADEDTGGDDASEDVVEPPPGAAGYCEATAEMFCAHYLRCGKMAVEDMASCRAVFVETCNGVFEPRYIALEARGALAYSPEGAQACAAHLETVACEVQLFDLDGPCRSIWAGQTDEGGACAPGVESFVCAPGTVCRLGLDFCGTCVPAANVGEVCGDGVSCAEGASCVEGVCVRRGEVGDACDAANPCRTGTACVDGACEGWQVVGLGERCDRDRRCAYKSTCTEGRCVEDVLLGEACGEGVGCTSGVCEGGVCVAFRGEGEACSAGGQCVSGACAGGRCAALPGACFEADGG